MRVFWLTSGALFAFASNSILCRRALESGAIDPGTYTSIRLLAGAAVLAVLSRGLPRLASGVWISGIALFAYASSFSFAYAAIPASTGALLLFAAVQATMLAGGLLRAEGVSAREAFGLLVASVGVLYLLSPGLAAPPPLPALLMLASGVAWGIYSLHGRACSSRLAPLEGTAGGFLVAAPLSLALSAFTFPNVQVSAEGLGLAIASGAFASALGYVLWHRALKALTAPGAAAVQLAVPLLTALGGFLFLSETLSPRLLASLAAVLGGIALGTPPGADPVTRGDLDLLRVQ